MKTVLEVVLVVDSWRGPGAVLLSPEADLALTAGDLHAGSTFPATITVDEDTAEELRAALNAGYQPVFWMAPPAMRSPAPYGYCPDCGAILYRKSDTRCRRCAMKHYQKYKRECGKKNRLKKKDGD